MPHGNTADTEGSWLLLSSADWAHLLTTLPGLGWRAASICLDPTGLPARSAQQAQQMWAWPRDWQLQEGLPLSFSLFPSLSPA